MYFNLFIITKSNVISKEYLTMTLTHSYHIYTYHLHTILPHILTHTYPNTRLEDTLHDQLIHLMQLVTHQHNATDHFFCSIEPSGKRAP